MYHKLDRNDPQKQIVLRYGGDGIADMIVGGAFLGIGLMLLSDMPVMPVWLVVFLPLISWGLKGLITVPRLSEAQTRVQGKEEGPAVQWIKLSVIAGVVLLAAAVLVTALSPGWRTTFLQPYLSWGMIGLSLASVLIIVGLICSSWRWAFYALLVVPAMVLTAAAGVAFPVALGALGVLIFLGGVLVAARFVATHPVIHGEQGVDNKGV